MSLRSGGSAVRYVLASRRLLAKGRPDGVKAVVADTMALARAVRNLLDGVGQAPASEPG